MRGIPHGRTKPMVSTVVIGAGPYGLSLGAHLKAKNIDFEIVGETMETWKHHMHHGMLVKSEPFASSLSDAGGRLSLANFFAERKERYRPVGEQVPLRAFLRYAEWCEHRTGLEVQRRRLLELTRTNNGFELQFTEGPAVKARRV